jgi:REP element-mobilizing transposase RayT
MYVHIDFVTKYRIRRIDDQIAPIHLEYIGGICQILEYRPFIVGGYRNHIHILRILSRKIAVMKLLENVKKSSSKWIKTNGSKYVNFY